MQLLTLTVALAHLTIANARIHFEYRRDLPALFPSTGNDASPDRPGNINSSLYNARKIALDQILKDFRKRSLRIINMRQQQITSFLFYTAIIRGDVLVPPLFLSNLNLKYPYNETFPM